MPTGTSHSDCSAIPTGVGRDRFDASPDILHATALPAIGYAGVCHFDGAIAPDPSDGANHFLTWPLTNYRAVEMRFMARHASVASKAGTARFWLARSAFCDEGQKKNYFEHFGKPACDVTLETSASPILLTVGQNFVRDGALAALPGQVAHIDTGSFTSHLFSGQIREQGGAGVSPYILQVETEGHDWLIGAFTIGTFTALRCAVAGI